MLNGTSRIQSVKSIWWSTPRVGKGTKGGIFKMRQRRNP